MSSVGEPSNRYDLFLSHGTPDKEWVRALQKELEAEGLRAFLDEKELKPGDNFVIGLSDGLKNSRFLILIITRETLSRPGSCRNGRATWPSTARPGTSSRSCSNRKIRSICPRSFARSKPFRPTTATRREWPSNWPNWSAGQRT